jgi:hypothetical protein
LWQAARAEAEDVGRRSEVVGEEGGGEGDREQLCSGCQGASVWPNSHSCIASDLTRWST